MPWDWFKINREDPEPVSDYPDYLDYPQFVRRRSFVAVLRRSLCLTRERYQQAQRAQRAQRLAENFGNLRYNAHKFGLPCIFVSRSLQCWDTLCTLTCWLHTAHTALLMFLWPFIRSRCRSCFCVEVLPQKDVPKRWPRLCEGQFLLSGILNNTQLS